MNDIKFLKARLINNHHHTSFNHLTKITVIIVNYNGGSVIFKCLQSLRAQTFKSFSVVVVDNNSTDGSKGKIYSDFPEVKVFALEKNVGFAAGNNYALFHSPLAEWVVLLNPDAFPNEDWLGRLVDTSEQYPGFDSFGSRLCTDSNDSVLDGTGDAYHVSGLVWRKDHGCAMTTRHLKRQEIFSPCAAAAMYRAQALLHIGGFDEDFFCYVEDVDLGFRMRLAGYRSLYEPDAIVQHAGSAIVGLHSDFQLYYGHRNIIWTYVKNMPALLFWVLLPVHLAMNIVGLVWFTLKGRGRVVLRAKWHGVKEVPRFWKKRQTIQSTRTMSTWRIFKQLTWSPFRK